MKLDISIFRFLIIGGSSTIIDFIIYYILSCCIDISISKCISMLCASIYSYFLNKYWTFVNDDKRPLLTIIKYYITFAVNMVINISVNSFIFYHTQSKIIAFIIATGIAMIINYLLQKNWVFKKNNEKNRMLRKLQSAFSSGEKSDG